MHRTRDVAARCVLVAGAVVGLGMAVWGCATQLDALRKDWAGIRAKGDPPCRSAAECRALIERLDRARREACGDAPKCEATADLEREIRPAVLALFKTPCEEGNAQACLAAKGFGYGDGLRAACDLGLAGGCIAACEQSVGEDAARRCDPIANDLDTLLNKCSYKREDIGEACLKLGVLVSLMSASAPTRPPLFQGNPTLYVTPLIEDRARSRYALDYLSRACYLGEPAGCRALCKRRPFDASTDLGACRQIVRRHTAKSLRTACRQREGRACHDLALLSSNMGFFDRDPAGFYISGPGRIVGLEAKACHLGVVEACQGNKPF